MNNDSPHSLNQLMSARRSFTRRTAAAVVSGLAHADLTMPQFAGRLNMETQDLKDLLIGLITAEEDFDLSVIADMGYALGINFHLQLFPIKQPDEKTSDD